MAVESGPIEFATSPWHVRFGEPTTFIAFLADEYPPAGERVADQLMRRGASEPDESIDLPPKQPHVHWQQQLALPGARGTAVLWCERTKPVDPGTFGDAAVEAAPWLIGTQLMLDIDDPCEAYAHLMQVLTTSLPGVVGMLDVNTNMCHPRSFIDDQLSLDEAPAPTDWLWRINVTAAQPDVKDHTPVTLRTTGLHRCWRAELELVNVPFAHVAPAAQLLEVLAEHSLDEPLPDPDNGFDIGAGLSIALRAPDSAAGEDEAHRPIARVVHSEDIDRLPIDLLRRLEAGDAALYRTERVTARQAALARNRWPHLVDAWRNAQGSAEAAEDHHFLVKAAIAPGAGQNSPREHLWFEIESIDEHGVTARPLRDSTGSDVVTTEQQFTIDPDGLSDWVIITPGDRLTPARFVRIETSKAKGNGQ